MRNRWYRDGQYRLIYIRPDVGVALNLDHILNDTITKLVSALLINIWTGNWRVKQGVSLFWFCLVSAPVSLLCDASKKVLLGTIQEKNKLIGQLKKRLGIHPAFCCLKGLSQVPFSNVFILISALSRFMIFFQFPHIYFVKRWLRA